MPLPSFFALVLVFLAGDARAADEEVTRGEVSSITLSPDGRFGVTVPGHAYVEKADGTYDDVKNPQNAIIEIKTGKVVGIIGGDVAFEHMNHDNLMPSCWTEDDATLLWQVDSKWGIGTIRLINLKGGKIAGQVDVLNLLQKEILTRTRTARPKDYASVKRGSDGYGSWFKDGFAIDVVLDAAMGNLQFPIVARVFLTSNTKGLPDITNLDSRLNAEINRDGTFKVTKFYLGQDPPAREWGTLGATNAFNYGVDSGSAFGRLPNPP